jgi:hypothetical protein
MGMNLLGLSHDAARLRRIAAILRDGMGEGERDAPIPAVVELLNRALRPVTVLSVLALVALAFVDPARYAAGVAVLAATPPAIWALCVLVLALHFLVPAVHRPSRT